MQGETLKLVTTKLRYTAHSLSITFLQHCILVYKSKQMLMFIHPKAAG